MAPTAREIALLLLAVLVFPLAMTLTSVTSSDGIPDRTTPLWHRGDTTGVPSAKDH
jgi:hypothetical protein